MSHQPRRRIAYVWDADYPWDVRTEKICRTLVDAGYDVDIIARNRQWRATDEVLAEGTVRRMPPWRVLGRSMDGALSFPAFANPRWLWLLHRQFRERRPDAVIVRDLPLGPAALWMARAEGIPVLLDMAENYPAMIRDVWDSGRAGRMDWLLRNPRAVEWVEQYLLPRVDHVITVVEESAERVVAMGVPARQVSVVSNTPPRARVAPARAPRKPGPLRLTYLGLMEVPRGIREVLESAAALQQEGRVFELLLIGDGRDRTQFESYASSLGLAAPTVRFTGALPNAEALRLVGESDVGLVPHHAVESWNTTIPNKLFDYMAAGLVVVSSDAIPADRIVRSTGAGVVFKSRDSADLTVQLRSLFDESVRARMADAGMEAVRHRYNWEYDTAVLLRHLEACIREAPSPST